MTWFLRQSTASQEIPLGPFLDSTDGNTQETGLTIANTDIKLFKTGATSEASKNSGGATHIANGRYYAVLDAVDTDTIGPLRVSVHVAGALAVWLECCVLDEAVFDVLFGTVAPATATNITAASGIAVSSIAANAITAAAIADGAIDSATFASGCTIPRVTLADTLTTYTGNTVQTGDSFARIGAAGAGLSAIPWNAAWDAEVQSEVEDGLNALGYTTTVSGRIDATVSSRLASASYTAPLSAAQTQTECEEALQTYHLDHLLASADPGSIVANSSLWAALVSKSATPAYSSYSNTTDSLEALRDRGDAAWTTATGFSTHSAADVWAVGTRSLTTLAGLTLPTVTNLTNLPAITADWVTAAGVSAGAANKIADHSRRRTQANVEASSDGDSLSVRSHYGHIEQAQKSTVSGSTWTIKKTDGTTLGTLTLTTDGTADPVTGVT